MIFWNKIIVLLICSLGLNSAIQAQTIYYYQLTKTKVNGIVSTQNGGGQFVCIYDAFCFDCDKNGKGVGNGQLHLKNRGEYITYFGESYFGKDSYYKFNRSCSNLNIITPQGDIYAYKRVAPPSDVKTCSLIKRQRNSSSTIIETPSLSEPTQTNNNTNPINNTNTSRKKTKVRKRCAYCNGKGERIQHEHVSTFGLDGPRVHCNICNQSWNYGTVHAHHKCNYCNGTGYYEYEY